MDKRRRIKSSKFIHIRNVKGYTFIDEWLWIKAIGMHGIPVKHKFYKRYKDTLVLCKFNGKRVNLNNIHKTVKMLKLLNN